MASEAEILKLRAQLEQAEKAMAASSKKDEEKSPLMQDEEAPKPKDDATPPAKAVSAFAAASDSDAFAAPRGAEKNPVFIAKMIFRKVATLLLSNNEDDITQPAGIITVLKDIIIGVILGVLSISILIFLDHHNVIHLESAHNFRNAAFNLLNDPETVTNLEESSGMKFMTLREYESKRKEIDGVPDKIANMETILETRSKEAETKKKELEEVRPEYDKLVNNELLGLNKFCGNCHWGQSFNCAARAQFLENTYNTRPIKAKVSAMSRPSCRGEK